MKVKKYKYGLVLSGGGTRGFAHLGAIAALNEHGITPDIISGTSAGSIAGVFIAAGYSPADVLQIFKKGWALQYTQLQIPIDGLLKLSGLKNIIKKHIEAKQIEDLKIPFYATISNLNSGKVEYKNKGQLDTIVLASSSIPVLFSPVEMNGNLYVDGGLMDNIPIYPLIDCCQNIIVVNISPINPKDKIKNLIQIATRTFYMSVKANMDEVKKHATLYIEPEGIDEYDILHRSHANELFDLGYKSTLEVLKQNQKAE